MATRTSAAFATTGLVLKLYRQHFGHIPLQDVDVPEPFDAAAALTADRTALTVGIVNPTAQSATLSIALSGATMSSEGKAWTIAGDDPMAYNEPGKPPKVAIVASTPTTPQKLPVTPLSVSLYRFPFN